MVGTILDEEANLVDVTATLVDLAVRGHLHIARDDQGVFRGRRLGAHPHGAARRRDRPAALRADPPRRGLRGRRPGARSPS